jgi:dTDP-4-dehydrorhamnose reductase
VNCTSYHKTDEVERNATLGIAINAHAVLAMAEVCESKGAAFFHVSTDYVFSGLVDRPYTEQDCPRPINVYGASKAMGETLAAAACTRTYSLRVASLFGIAGSSGKGGNFVETMIRLAREKGEVQVVNDITMSPTSTEDVSEWIFRLIEARPKPGVYHAVNSGSATWFQFAQEIIRQARIDARAVPLTSDQFPTVARRPHYSVLDNSKLASIVGPLPTWQEALGRYFRRRRQTAANA